MIAILAVVLLLMFINISIAKRVGSDTVWVGILTIPFGIIVTAYLLIKAIPKAETVVVKAEPKAEIIERVDGTCSTCKYARLYEEPYVMCDKIKTTFPNEHFCAYYAK